MDINEILKEKQKCLHEEPVHCTTACPVHVDIRLLMEKVQNGDFSGAYKHYASHVFFPGILSRICDEPCKSVCMRKNHGEPLSIGLIEKACFDYTEKKESSLFAPSVKKEKVCIIGGGISGMTCAVILARKGYNVAIYEKCSVLGGHLWKSDSAILPSEVINDEIDRVVGSEYIDIRLDTKIESLGDVAGDAIFIATGRGGNTLGVSDKDSVPVCDPISLESTSKGVFAGGSILMNDYSAITSVAHGIRAARSIERYFRNASLTAGRETETYKNTNLIVNKPAGEKCRVFPQRDNSGWYTREEAIQEALRCYLCECSFCMDACEMIKYYKMYPSKMMEIIFQSNTNIKFYNPRQGVRMINSCNLCGLCEKVCPTRVAVGEACISSRRNMYKGGKLAPAFHDFWIRDMKFTISEAVIISINGQDLGKIRYMFFPGCQMGASDPVYVEKAYDYLLKHLNSVAINTGCCGAPAQWAGRESLHQEVVSGIINTWESSGKPVFILACPSCKKMFDQFIPQIKTISLWSIIHEFGLPEDCISGVNSTITVFDPCASRYDRVAQECVRKILQEADYNIEELPYHGEKAQCCSYGGLIYGVNPNLARKIINRRVNESPNDYVTYCTNCRDTFASGGKSVMHILDVLFGKGMGDRKNRLPTTLSQRRENRILLKQGLLKKICGTEFKMEKHEYEKIKLIVSPEISEKIDKELILLDDIRQVINYAETTENRIFNEDNGYYTSHLQIGIITYWVEYMPNGYSYEIFGVYSHRMKIREAQ